MILSSEVMTCGFDWWEETMQHNDIGYTNNGREASIIGLPTEFQIVMVWMVTKSTFW